VEMGADVGWGEGLVRILGGVGGSEEWFSR
jgi:hypothetical protein